MICSFIILPINFFTTGHYYGIGDCGQAMVTSKCPECGETIGGTSHILVGTSQAAEELNTGLQVPAHIQNPFEVYYR